MAKSIIDRIKVSLSVEELMDLVYSNEDLLEYCHAMLLNRLMEDPDNTCLGRSMGDILVDIGICYQVETAYYLINKEGENKDEQ